MKILNTVGVPCEKAWPYNTKTVGSPESWANLVSRWSLGGEYTRLETPEYIINSLKNNGPMPIGIGCFAEIFYTTEDGIVGYPEDPDTCYGGHAVCLVGWNPDTKMFKFKNSWGTSWGKEGYGYLPYNYIKDFCWDAWEIKDLSVTKEMLKK
jgi:C1A family cysteine protease